ncbi:MAG TPA: M20 family metallo-hydrolase [Candidatus Acidoferrales bacterium]|nr:M20 family metallo-hydrolase [Candidatus Acidoferrales bacterium]
MRVDIDRLSRELETLAGFSDAPAPAVTRVVYSETDRRARAWVRELCCEAGLAVREDGIGNIFARWPGEEPGIATGSHIDAIPHAGRYDGTVGVLGGLEAIRMLQRAGVRPRRSIELVVFCAEEPTRFGIGCFGSRMLVGLLDGSELRDREGKSLRDWVGNHGSVRLPKGHYAAFIELHIEQGPLLERSGIPLGIVTAIAAPATWHIFIEGEGGHAGAVLMPDRKDAFCAAAEAALAVERAARSSGAIDTVGTTGVCDVFPGAVNSVPSRVRIEMDVRDIDGARRDRVLGEIEAACAEIAARRGVTIRKQVIHADPPATCDARVIAALEKAAGGMPYQKMVSRAYHDSLFMARIVPAGMLFIPCRGGVSHRPDEYAAPEAIASGVAALAGALASLAND